MDRLVLLKFNDQPNAAEAACPGDVQASLQQTLFTNAPYLHMDLRVCITAGETAEAESQVLLKYMASLTEQGQPWTSGPLCSTQGHPTALQPEFSSLATPGADPFLGPSASQLPLRALRDWHSIENPNFNSLWPQSRCI